jgi:hypothetical protein
MSTLGQLEVAFKNADEDGNQSLSVAELAKAQSLTEVQAQSLIDYFSAGDEMTFSEYIVMTKVLKSDVSGVFKVSARGESTRSDSRDPRQRQPTSHPPPFLPLPPPYSPPSSTTRTRAASWTPRSSRTSRRP